MAKMKMPKLGKKMSKKMMSVPMDAEEMGEMYQGNSSSALKKAKKAKKKLRK